MGAYGNEGNVFYELKQHKYMTKKELATEIKELNKYLDKNPWDIIKRQERSSLVEELCDAILKLTE